MVVHLLFYTPVSFSTGLSAILNKGVYFNLGLCKEEIKTAFLLSKQPQFHEGPDKSMTEFANWSESQEQSNFFLSESSRIFSHLTF